MGNFFGIFSDIGKSIGTADTIQRQGKVLRNAATGAAKGVGNFFKKGVSINNPFKNVGNSAKKFVNGFGKGLRGPRRETVYYTNPFGLTTKQTHYKESSPTSLLGLAGSAVAHEYLRNQKKKINGTNSSKSKKGSIFNRFRKNTGVKSEEQQPPQQNNTPIKTKPNSRIENSSQQFPLPQNNKLLNTNPISSIESSLQQSSLPPKNVNPNSSKNNNSLQISPQHNNTPIKTKPNSKIENSSQQSPEQLKNVNNNSRKNKNPTQPPSTSKNINPISSIVNNQQLQQKGGNKKKSSKKNLSENKKKTSKK
jgi:hypothetical protein